ncbi:MAG: dihydroorotase family protein [Proteobacteria bacterium]|nr:dihydroorotase family protein [Pseudomonadota bacterium]
MTFNLILRDATLVSSAGRQVADVAIRDGRIAYVGPNPPRAAEQEISAIGMFLMPGVIDTAVQFDPAGNPSDWERESRAAVTGGVTSVISLPGGTHPVISRATARARAKRANGHSWCNYGLWGAANNGNAQEISEAAREGLIVGTLAYLGQQKGNLVIEPERLETFMKTEGVLGVQIQDINVEDEPDSPNGGCQEVEAVLSVARSHGRFIHLVHLSTAAELQTLDPVHGDIPITTGVTPHHLFLSLDESKTIRTRPPVRPEQDRRTLWTAVKRGRLDCVASDHHPTSNGNGATGVPGTELLFPLMLSAVKYGRLSLELLVSLCSERPARIFGLEQKGRIERGADADLILFSEGEVARVTQKSLLSGAGWSPYCNREAAPKPEYVIVNGTIVANRGKLIANKPTGKLITHVAQA